MFEAGIEATGWAHTSALRLRFIQTFVYSNQIHLIINQLLTKLYKPGTPETR